MAKKQNDSLLKLLMIGDSSVGKTSIVHRFAENDFSPVFISTIGLSFLRDGHIFNFLTIWAPPGGIDFKIKTIVIKGKKVKLQIWDTAGQERFHTMSTNYYRNAMGIMLVYDVTNAKSFDNISKWLRNIDQYASEGVEKMLLGNKRDLADQRMVSEQLGQKVACDHNIRFLETSARANINIDKAFYDLAEAILDKIPCGTDNSTRNVTELPDYKKHSWSSTCC